MNIIYLYNGLPCDIENLDRTWGTSQGLSYYLKELGHTLHEVNFKKFDCFQEVYNLIESSTIDVIMLSEAGTIPEHVKSFWKKENFQNVLMLAEGCDEPQIMRYNLGHTMPADVVLSSDMDSVGWYASNGKKSFWFPHWGDELVYSYSPDPCNGKISTSSGPRKGLWSESVTNLKNHFGENFVAPRLNGEPYLTPSDNNKLYAESSIVFQASSHGEITRRLFEAAVAGRMILCDRLSSSKKMNLIFEEEKEIEYFSDVKELVDKTRYYLEHHEERIKMAERARDKCLNFHTARKRAEQLTKILESSLK